MFCATDSEHGGFKIVAPVKGGGVRRTTTIDFELMNSPEFHDLQSLFAELFDALELERIVAVVEHEGAAAQRGQLRVQRLQVGELG